MAPKKDRPPKKKKPPDVVEKKKNKRTYKRRPGEFIKTELVVKILEHPKNEKKKSHLTKLGKRELCDIASSLGIISEAEHLASLARRSEGRKCYFWTLLREERLRPAFDEYVQWWSEVWARGTTIANAFVCSNQGLTGTFLMDLTRLKTLLLPERHTAGVSQGLEGLVEWMSSPSRRRALQEMLPTRNPSGTVVDQALCYMARRLRGNIKNHLLVHLHDMMTRLYRRRYEFAGRSVTDEKKKDLGVVCKRAIVMGSVDDIRDVNERWRVVKLRESLGLGPDDVAGKAFDDGTEEDVAIANVAEEDDDSDNIPSGIEAAWIVHKKLCELGLTTMLPLGTPSRTSAIIDKKIAFSVISTFNKSCTKASEKVALDSEDTVLDKYFLPSRREMKTSKANKKKTHRHRARKQFIRSGCGKLVPKNGVLSTISTDGVAATATFDVPIIHRSQVLLKKSVVTGILSKMLCGCHSGCCSCHQASSSSSPPNNDRGPFSAADMAALANVRLIADDPGDVNPGTTVELGRLDPKTGHREVIHNQMSRRRYEKRTLRKSHQQWEASRRRDNYVYRKAIDDMSAAGTWRTSDVGALDRMIDARAKGWAAMKKELIVDKEHVRRKMLMYRKRRMVLDQTAQRIVDPKASHIDDKKTRGVILGVGQAIFKSRGPTKQLLKALIRAMKRLRAEGRPAFIVFVDEYLTTQLCHRCFGQTRSPLKKVKNKPGMKVADHRFRDCPHCGSQSAPKRWGRDTNAALNILRNLLAMLMGTQVPEQFRRPERGAMEQE